MIAKLIGLVRSARAVPGRIRRKYFSRTDQIRLRCSSLLPEVACVDVGASYYPHPAWEVFRMSPSTTWVAIDPNSQNLSYLKTWSWPASLIPVADGVSGKSGQRDLFVTNIDSGSSLLEPIIPEGMKHRYEPGYFFPVRKVPLATFTLREILARFLISTPIAIKVDTQGSELEIVEGLSDELIRDQVICVELESTLAAAPCYIGASRFFAVQQFMEARGFELVTMKPIDGSLPRVNASLRSRYVLVECDAVFLLRPDVMEKRPVSHKLAMLGCYVAYELYGEAQHLATELAGRVSAEQQKTLDSLQALLS